MNKYEILTLILGVVLSGVTAWIKRKNYVDSALVDSIEAGVRHAWEDYGKARKAEIKAENGNGKFNEEDKQILKEKAFSKADEVLADLKLPSLDKLVSSENVKKLMLERVVSAVKGKVS